MLRELESGAGPLFHVVQLLSDSWDDPHDSMDGSVSDATSIMALKCGFLFP